MEARSQTAPQAHMLPEGNFIIVSAAARFVNLRGTAAVHIFLKRSPRMTRDSI
jgi:hypothetical protein